MPKTVQMVKNEDKIITNEELFEDLKKVVDKYKKKNPKAKNLLTRDFYRKNSNYKESDYSKFGSFKDFIEVFKKGNKEIQEFENEKQLIILQDEISKLKQDKDKLLKRSITEDNLLDIYKESVVKEFKYKVFPLKKESTSNKDFILNFSDLHLGEVVIPEEVNFVNEFNKNIAIKRMDQLFDKLVKYAKKIVVRDLHIEMNGDLFSGGIHQELVRNSDLNEVDAIFYLQHYMIPKLCSLSEYFDHIFVDVLVGNHPRILIGKPYFKEQVKMNFEYIFGKQLQMYFDLLSEQGKNDKIRINIPESPFMIKQVRNTKFLVTHGDILTGAGTGGFLGLPAYSTAMSAAKLYGILHQLGITEETKFDHIIAGHLHTTSKIPIFNGGFCFYGGCIIGTNEFSLFKMKSVAKKEQLVLIIDDQGIDGEINIRLD
jgi:hypothetical protein